MHKFRFTALAIVLQLAFITQGYAGDFDWLKQMSIQAQADPSGFAARLSTRFHIGGTQVEAVIDNVGGQADAYMVLRLAEMSHQPVAYVTQRYHENRHRGWGVLARQLGIKPGSREFHALKAGHDLAMGRDDGERDNWRGNGHGNGHGRGDHGNHGRGRGHNDD